MPQKETDPVLRLKIGTAAQNVAEAHRWSPLTRVGAKRVMVVVCRTPTSTLSTSNRRFARRSGIGIKKLIRRQKTYWA